MQALDLHPGGVGRAGEQAAGQQYQQMLQQASAQRALAPADNAQRNGALHAKRIIPFTDGCNPRSRQWRWMST